MSAKTTGAEFKRFYNSSFWLEDTYHEAETVVVNGKELEDQGFEDIPDDAAVTISGGIVYNAKMGNSDPSFEAYFKRWRKKQSAASFVVECDIAKRDAVVAAIRAAGGRIA